MSELFSNDWRATEPSDSGLVISFIYLKTIPVIVWEKKKTHKKTVPAIILKYKYNFFHS